MLKTQNSNTLKIKFFDFCFHPEFQFEFYIFSTTTKFLLTFFSNNRIFVTYPIFNHIVSLKIDIFSLYCCTIVFTYKVVISVCLSFYFFYSRTLSPICLKFVLIKSVDSRKCSVY